MRARRRANAAGFTLLELLVSVMIVSILAILAIPGMRQARDDRAAFSYARTFSAIIHRARVRAAGRGAAHLVVWDAGSASRGRLLLFEALDGTAAPSGPNPVSSCKAPAQWTNISAIDPANGKARLIEALDLNTAGINVDADIKSELLLLGGSRAAGVLCVTPGGSTYAGYGSDMDGAVTDMEGRIPFTDVFELRIARHKAGSVVGLMRRVIAAGTSAPRIKSE